MGAILTVSGKTRKPRYIRLVMSAPYLATWKKDYPRDPEGAALVFIGIWRKRNPGSLEILRLRRIHREARDNAKIKKKVTPYIFRHLRITHMVEQEIPESLIKLQAWGSLRTGELETYTHVTKAFMDQVMLEKAPLPLACRSFLRDEFRNGLR